MLATQLNDLVTSKEIEVKAVVQLDKYICNIIQETRLVWKVHLILVQRMGFPKGWFTHSDLLSQRYLFSNRKFNISLIWQGLCLSLHIG